MNMTLQDIVTLLAVIAAILGWAYQLGFTSARIQRNEQDIADLKSKLEEARRDRAEEIKELQKAISAGLKQIYEKLDKLPCKNAGWKPGDC